MAVVSAGIMGVFLLRIPIQLSDSYTEFQSVYEGSLMDTLRSQFQAGPYLRPFRRGLIKVVYELSGGNYQPWFRGFQVAQLLVLLLLVVGALRVRTKAAAAMVPVTLAMVLGIHTFSGAILEGLPINHFLTILICCAAAINLSRARPSWLVDIAAVVLLVFAMLTIESGLVVAAVLVASYLVGYRGVSVWAVGAVVLTVGVYAYGRFVWLGGSTPDLGERSAGFGFRVLDTGELIRRFGPNPLPFYLYNFVSAISAVLFAEPRGGVWVFVDTVLRGRIELWRLITVVSSTAMTGVLLAFAAQRLGRWRRGVFDSDADRMVVIFAGVLLGNAVFAFAYAKDAILGPAGLFYALAASAVLQQFVTGVAGLRLPHRALAFAMTIVACGWSIRLMGIHYSLQVREGSTRNEWAYYEEWERKQHFEEPFTAMETQILNALRRQAIRGGSRVRRAPNGLADRVFDITQ